MYTAYPDRVEPTRRRLFGPVFDPEGHKLHPVRHSDQNSVHLPNRAAGALPGQERRARIPVQVHAALAYRVALEMAPERFPFLGNSFCIWNLGFARPGQAEQEGARGNQVYDGSVGRVCKGPRAWTAEAWVGDV